MPVDRPNLPELLAPAGDWDAMRAAVANGANAVYFGLSNFNARHRATNFEVEELAKVMEYLHAHNVRGYVTFNTLIFSDELPEAVEHIRAIARAGADAVIVQDLGIARLAARVAPTLSVHGSTQMTLTEPRGVEFVRGLGVQRVILARELSVIEIGKIAAATPVPVEVFIHGALCVSYSGQCLTSESLGGRSANRGQCAQACRLPYDLVVDGQTRDLGDKAYLLSPQDLAAYDMVDELVSSGVCSLKIEGRLKSAQYVAATTQTYRAALDATIAHAPFKIDPQQLQDLHQSFSRGFTHGFLDGVNHQRLVHARFPKSRGLRLGTVSRLSADGVVLSLDPEQARRVKSNPAVLASLVKPGDGIVFDEGHPEQDEQGGRVYAVRPMQLAGSKGPATLIELGFAAGHLNLHAIAPGAIVWKTDDPAVRKRLAQSFSRESVVHRTPLHVRVTAPLAGALEITFRDGAREVSVAWPGPLQLAQKFPISEPLLREQLSRLGDTPYELAGVELTTSDAVMVPKSVLNDLRRQATQKLLEHRAASHEVTEAEVLAEARAHAAAIAARGPQAQTRASCLTVMARTLDQLRAATAWTPPEGAARPEIVYCDFEDVRKYKDAVAIARAEGMPVALATLRIVKPGEEGLFNQLADAGPDGVLVRNLAALSYYREKHPSLALYGDYAMNVSNEITASIFIEAGLRRLVPSYDLSWKQLVAMLTRFPAGWFETVIHQHMPMFHMEHCVFAHTLSTGTSFKDCGRPCDRHQVDLRDRVGQSHPLIPDVGCRNTVYNAAAQSAAEYAPRMKELGIGHFRVELLREDAGLTQSLLTRYANVLLGKEDTATMWRSLKVLSQLGVTRGTLDFE